ncbi:MAG TPA: ankyrin repeat domain-containing protein [Ramlibacter sp.]|nr:ankyrin repeat domain-containing protein [Ramlibacter sp.]
MRNCIRLIVYLVVTIGISSAIAGSYDDFFVAIKRDDADTVRALLQRGFDPNTPSLEHLDGLYVALRDGSLKVAQVLADWPKANVDTRTDHDETPLMMACLRGQADIARKLIARGADVNKAGWTPLHYAATSGNVTIIRMLLDENAYIDADSPNGSTPLMMAAMYGTPESVKLLLDSGADPTLKNQLGLTALDFAKRADRKDAAELVTAGLRAWQARRAR